MSAAPPEASLFEPVADAYGPRLALVFRNHAPEGVCPYYAAGRCHHCDIGAGEGAAATPADSLARLAWFADRYAGVLPTVAHLVLYNSGSVLNAVEMPDEVLRALLGFARSLPAVRAVSLDSREAYFDADRLAALARALGPGRTLRPILGLETADEGRRALLDKRMPQTAVLRAFQAVGDAARPLGADAAVGLDVNVVVGGPGAADPEAATRDAAATAAWAFEAGRAAGVPRVDLNVHPYYPSRRGLARFPGHPRCTPETAARAVRAMAAVRDRLAPRAALFIGWQDEGHDQEPAHRAAFLARARAAFDLFNRTQDPAALDLGPGA